MNDAACSQQATSNDTLQGRSGASPTLAVANVLIVVEHEVRPSRKSGLPKGCQTARRGGGVFRLDYGARHRLLAVLR